MDKEQIRQGVVKSLPLVNEIKSNELREKVIEAWTMALSANEYTAIEELEGSGKPGGYILGNQAQHIMCVTRMALSMAEIIEQSYDKDMGIDRDMLLAAGLVHDVGKPYEYNLAKQAAWNEAPEKCGLPSLRHTLYGVYIALSVGLPEEIVHVCGCHSPEGNLVKRSLLATIIHHADKASWRIPGCADRWVFPD
ncbi:MAG: HD domain-containing protein [Candidatus Heteroscillospira sp.]|jgi:putative nucleotidyltransferase with HDIG domain